MVNNARVWRDDDIIKSNLQKRPAWLLAGTTTNLERITLKLNLKYIENQTLNNYNSFLVMDQLKKVLKTEDEAKKNVLSN